ncbi:MAG: cation:proton antiporter [Vicinamibacterales bacterium]
MTVPILFALVGLIILVGFLANLLFRITKIPSVLVLIAIGVVLGPLTGWIQHDSLLTIAPYFGAIALLVILFEGGLELEIDHVVRHAPRTAIFTTVVFALSMATVAAIAHLAVGLPLTVALMLGAVLGATSPAICMPVVSGLSVRNDVKTVIKLESAMGEVLLIVSVVLLIQSHDAGTADAATWVWGFARSLGVALLVATIAGVLWSRLVGWMGREPLSYMLTLGVTCLLYFVVEELGGSPAIAVLLFGLLLANMPLIANRVGPLVRRVFGVDVREEQFLLGQFMVNITAELSFLVRTFFFVYLGLLLDLSALSWSLGGWILFMFGLLLTSRRAGVALFRKSGASFTSPEWQVVMALEPRGLATAVVAFLPVQARIAAAELFPLFAFAIIVLSNLYMTGGVLFAERRLRQLGATPPEGVTAEPALPDPGMPSASDEPPAAVPVTSFEQARRPPLLSPARDFEDEPAPTGVVDWFARVFGLRLADREVEYAEMIRASYLSEPLFWVQAVLGASICALGLILAQPMIVVGGALVVPVGRPVVATGLALASGDLLLLAKLLAKLFTFSALAIAVSASLIGALPLAATTSDIIARTRPTILDFLVALCGGMAAAAMVSPRHRTLQYLPGAVVGITLVPALCVVGFAMTDVVAAGALQKATLQFSTNLFAASLGAGLVLLAVGIPRAAQSPTVRQWKEEELATPLASAVFRGLGLERAIGRTGSVRARFIVVGVFLLILITPLQQALNDVRAELRTRQAVARAQEAFNIANRSAVLGSVVSVADNEVSVRLQVATNEPFSTADVARFEAQVIEEAGRPARLDLVQTMADVGNAGVLGRLMAERQTPDPSGPPRTPLEVLREAKERLTPLVHALPWPPGMEVLALRSTMGEALEPTLSIAYLSEQELSLDAQAVLTGVVAAQTRIPRDRLALDWVPASRSFGFSRNGRLGVEATAALQEVRDKLSAHPTLVVTVHVPDGTPATVSEAVARRVQAELTLENLAPVTVSGTAAATATVRLQKPGS